MLPNLLTLGERWTFLSGKGGVGKTTTAAALGVALADAGERVLVLSIDPAHSLGDALGVPLGPEPEPVEGVTGLSALEVNPESELFRFLDSHRSPLAALIERGTHLDRADVDSLLDLAFPGLDELAALLALLRLTKQDASRRIIIDTAPTGHTLRLLQFPHMARDWVDAFREMDARYRAVAEALTGRTLPTDASTQALDELEVDIARFAQALHDPDHTRFVIVTEADPVVRAETQRLSTLLGERGLAIGGIVVNHLRPYVRRKEALEGVGAIDGPISGSTALFVPELPGEPAGLMGLRRFGAAVRRFQSSANPAMESGAVPRPGDRAGELTSAMRPSGAILVGESFSLPADRRIYLTGGKGGVGKTTLASALAAWLADNGSRVLLLSTDPAGSLGDVFGTAVDASGFVAPDVPGLELRQIDAEAAWEAFRARYREVSEGWFDELLGPGLSAEADRRVFARLIDLTPPGVDELMALIDIVDLSDQSAYNALVIDTAPTGHLLRLLELPRVGLDWAHALLRLLLKYRSVTGLGDLAERLLQFARSLRTLRARLEDRSQTMVVTVSRAEALAVPETGRLLARLAGIGMRSEVLFANRLLTRDGSVQTDRAPEALRLIEIAQDTAVVGVPEWEAGPRGADELRQLAAAWRRVRSG